VTFARQHAQEFGISIPEWRVIATLANYGTISSRVTTEKSGMDEAKVSRAVIRLTAAQLVKRDENADDSRSNLLSLTQAGMAINDQIVPIALELEQQLIQSLSDEERKVFDIALSKLSKRIDEMSGDNGPIDPHV